MNELRSRVIRTRLGREEVLAKNELPGQKQPRAITLGPEACPQVRQGGQAGSLLWSTLSNFGFPGGPDGIASVCSAGDPGSIPGLGRSTGEGNGSPLQYSCLENPMDGRAW